jgi:hypothetical protein
MEARFAQLEGLVTSMVTQVKYITSEARKAKDQKYNQSYGLNVNQGFFCGASFSRSMALDDTMPHMSRDHGSWVTNDGDHVMVPNPSEMISIATLVTRANEHVPEP